MQSLHYYHLPLGGLCPVDDLSFGARNWDAHECWCSVFCQRNNLGGQRGLQRIQHRCKATCSVLLFDNSVRRLHASLCLGCLSEHFTRVSNQTLTEAMDADILLHVLCISSKDDHK